MLFVVLLNASCRSPLQDGQTGTGRRALRLSGRFATYLARPLASDPSLLQTSPPSHSALSLATLVPARPPAGTKMVFAGLKKPDERADLIAFLKDATAK